MPDRMCIKSLVCRYGIPSAAVAVALCTTSAILPVLRGIALLPLLVAVAVSTWYGRRIGGVIALLIGSLWSLFFHLPPLYALHVTDPADATGLALFVLSAGVLILFLESRQQLLDEYSRVLHRATEQERTVREKQEEVVHAAKLAMIGQLAAGITHELNNPLNNVNLYLGMLRDLARTHDLDQAKLTQWLEEAQGQVKRAAEIVSHLRLFARGGEAPRRSCCLDEIICRALSFVQEPLRLAGVTATFIRSSMEPLIEGNETQLEQVFVNLLLNAKDAMSQSVAKRITITTRLEHATATVEVTDTGPGISPDIAHRLFTPFTTTKPPGDGLGLGLSICSSIMQMHRGRIFVAPSSPQRGGATFVVTFPVLQATPRVNPASNHVLQ